ncbi:hypothetical protein DIZ76_012175 [Coccidioides immitis]|nr:hypothetical protein DIZ76_012175 [Coccidioides immitis]
MVIADLRIKIWSVGIGQKAAAAPRLAYVEIQLHTAATVVNQARVLVKTPSNLLLLYAFDLAAYPGNFTS